MHPSAKLNGEYFFKTYANFLYSPLIVEIGSQNVNGSLRDVAPLGSKYIGVDFVEGLGVDLVLTDPYSLPIPSSSADIVVTSSCFEHSEMFWVLFLEGLRILKPNGLFYLNVPSNGDVHNYPVDCWRFYPNAGHALASWGKRNGYSVALIESYVSRQIDDIWNDFVAVFLKDVNFINRYPDRIIDRNPEFENGWIYGANELINPMSLTEDAQRYRSLEMRLRKCEEKFAELTESYNQLLVNSNLLAAKIKSP